MREFRNHGMLRDPARFENRELAFDGNQPNPWYYEMSEIGWNYRLPDLLCALGQSQLKKLPRFWQRRREIAARYDELLAPLSSVLRPAPHDTRTHGWHLYAVLIDFPGAEMTRAALMNALRADGIGTQVHYLPLHQQPYYRNLYGELSLPGAEAYYARCLSLPMFPAMTDGDVERVAEALTRLVRRS
jgi:dTDP-4-amino-4,6-dideoxygalactose transaminase